MDDNSLAHTQWNCKYHIVFAPKFRRQIIYGRLKVSIGRILRELCERKHVEIIDRSECMPRSYTYVGKDTAKDVSSRFYGVSEGEKLADDI